MQYQISRICFEIQRHGFVFLGTEPLKTKYMEIDLHLQTCRCKVHTSIQPSGPVISFQTITVRQVRAIPLGTYNISPHNASRKACWVAAAAVLLAHRGIVNVTIGYTICINPPVGVTRAKLNQISHLQCKTRTQP